MTPPQEDYRTITLTRGQVAIVDAADFEWLSQWKWCASRFKNGLYASRKGTTGRITVLMHRQILGLEHGDTREGDHINRNPLDNRRCNLRICTRAQNRLNISKRSSNTSGFKGVVWSKYHQKWLARIGLDYRCHHLGYFDTPESASAAYDHAAIKLHGEFAALNSASA